jgi:hypothetical protein
MVTHPAPPAKVKKTPNAPPVSIFPSVGVVLKVLKGMVKLSSRVRAG